jgi:hypothetical protein
MIADHERFKDLCAGVQSLAIAAAVLIGGLWRSISAGQAVRTGDKDDLPFLVKVAGAGIYLVSFNAQLKKEDFGNADAKSEEYSDIGISRYIVVK